MLTSPIPVWHCKRTWPSIYGATAYTLGKLKSIFALSNGASTITCAVVLSTAALSFPCNPPIIELTTIREPTPIAIPIIDKKATNVANLCDPLEKLQRIANKEMGDELKNTFIFPKAKITNAILTA